MRRKRRIVAVAADSHCGSLVGLTPPEWQLSLKKDGLTKRNKYAVIQRDLWDTFRGMVRRIPPIDLLFFNGDAIDGKNARSGGTENITLDLEEQADMAVEVIKTFNADNVVMTYGTSYHTSSASGEDWENEIAADVGAKIGAHEFVRVNGVMFDAKHHIGNSSIPHGRYTALARDAMWNVLWAERDEQPKSDIIIRSHVHRYSYCEDVRTVAITTPALEGMGSKFGSRRCSGTVDFGLLWFAVEPDGTWDFHREIMRIASQAATVMEVR